jgi:hypothetical protein
LFSTDTINSTGGNDVISTGSGRDQVIAGVGDDTVTNVSGETIVIGDDGRIESDTTGRYLVARTGDTTIGGNDSVTGGSDRDILFGGFGDDRLDGQAGSDVIGGDGSQITRTATTIVFEAIDLFVGGNDTILGGLGLDRMQGHFGGDLFFASFNEDVFIGEYGRFTFSTDESDVTATSIISLAQGPLDLIRQLQTSLFSGFAKQAFFESNLGQAARSRTALTTVFTDSAQTAVAGLSATTLQATSSGAAQGADFVIPTEPTAAGVPVEAPVDGEQPEGEQPTGEASQGEQATGTEGQSEQITPEEEAQGDVQPQENQQECEVKAEDGSCQAPDDVSSEQSDNKANSDQQTAETLLALDNGIDVHAALAAVGGWAVMKDTSGSTKSKKKQKVA